jgi:rod shape-determining protein MreD
MAEALLSRLWVARGIYLLLAAAILFTRMLPLDTEPERFLQPDLLLCMTVAWVIRRPEQMNPLLIASVFLLCDFVFLRPPGLWTLLVVLATEFLRRRESITRELPFPLEWALVSAVLLGAVLIEALVLAVFAVPHAGLGVALLHMLVTLLAYAPVVGALWLGLGLRRAAPGEVDGLGRRL